MAAALDLDPGSYGGTYKLIGGSLALDFANLVSYRDTARAHDWLMPPENVRAWATACGLGAVVDADIAAARDLRECVARVFLALVDSEVPADADIQVLSNLVRERWSRRELTFSRESGVAVWRDEHPTLAAIIAEDAVRLLTSREALDRLAACDDCRWLFLDTTRNHSRRWCDPADCGNRARQRAHYRRSHGA